MSWVNRLSTGRKVALGFAVVFGLSILIGVLFGKEKENNEYKPQNEFKLDPWVELKLGPIDMSLNKAVLYLLIAAALTCWAMTYIAKRMRERPHEALSDVEPGARDPAEDRDAGGDEERQRDREDREVHVPQCADHGGCVGCRLYRVRSQGGNGRGEPPFRRRRRPPDGAGTVSKSRPGDSASCL